MSTETGLYRKFAKAFARKIAYLLCWVGIFLVAVVALFGAMFVITEIATFVLSAIPLENTRLTHLSMSILVMMVIAGLLKTAHSAWEEAKTDFKEKSE